MIEPISEILRLKGRNKAGSRQQATDLSVFCVTDRRCGIRRFSQEAVRSPRLAECCSRLSTTLHYTNGSTPYDGRCHTRRSGRGDVTGGVQYPKLDMGVAELRDRFGQQLRMEQADTVTIDSVEASKPVTERMARRPASPHGALAPQL
ncbi:hypothetical protein AAFF_G00219260 [Aldrovandia affinis]|uniref:Uncharacterized protein n=1 Tax=Aldrovandia affinis TaxID=143900 RepID=A0AAD7W449_9TELE|nr:hypothetical protein AAFF_G00219260 [Aldrovandia affinis]